MVVVVTCLLITRNEKSDGKGWKDGGNITSNNRAPNKPS